MSNTKVEKLVYGLQIELVDMMDPGGYTGDTSPMEELYQMCPMDQLRTFVDPEMFREHLDNMTESRKVVEHEDKLRASGHSVVGR